MNIKDIKSKLTSRKFLMAASGVLSGILLIVSDSHTEGVTAIVASVVAYLAAEGFVDMNALHRGGDGRGD